MQKVVEALRSLGIERLNDLQKVVIPKIAEGRNVLVVAPTGSGKTECAVIPTFCKILKEKMDGIAMLYVTPLRALNRDLLRRLSNLAKALGLSIAVRHGDTAEVERRRQAKEPPQILITTPETLQLLLVGRRLRKALENLRFLVVDEVHELAESERGVQLAVALERLREISNFQIIGLSATVSNAEDVARFFGISEVIVWKGNKRYEFRVIKEKDAVECVRRIIEAHESALVFVNTRQTAEALGLALKETTNVEVHHGSLSKTARMEAEERFSRGELKALICTSSMELGIDIGHVEVVVQFGSPREVGRLIQRVGRSGHREGKVSFGYIVTKNFDEVLESWVIVDRALRGEIEETRMHEGCLDVLANQICAITLEYGEIDAERCYEIVSRARPFRNLKFEDFLRVCEFLAEGRLVRFNGSKLKPSRKTRRHFYDNVSMIPDERRFKVVDVTTGRAIGYLDESFVATFEGSAFTMKGEPWSVVDVDDVVRVEPFTGEGEIPVWVGEEIPVPFEVAQEVGKVRGWIAGMIVSGVRREEIIEVLMDRFRTNEEACEEVLSVIERQIKEGFTVPTDCRITVEGRGRVVVNCCFGHRVNETLGRILALLLSAKMDVSVSVEIDPYRIKLTPANAEDVAEILKSLSPEAIEELIKRAVKGTKLMQWRIVHCARKFGYLSKSADTSKINVQRLVERLEGTPIFEEALREILHERLDLERTKEVVGKIGREITVSVYSDLSPISLASEDSRSDVLIPAKPRRAIVEAFKRRLDEETCVLYCLNCGCRIRSKVKAVDRLECVRCGSKMVACVNARRRLEDVGKRELFRIANLVMAYGKRAVYALNTLGVGVETASKILAKPYRSEEEFFSELLEAEKRFIRTRRFWD